MVQFEDFCKRGYQSSSSSMKLPSSPCISHYRCFHGMIEAKEAELRLGVKKKKKEFLLRLSARDPSCLTISRGVRAPMMHYSHHALKPWPFHAVEEWIPTSAYPANGGWVHRARGKAWLLLRHVRGVARFADRKEVGQEYAPAQLNAPPSAFWC